MDFKKYKNYLKQYLKSKGFDTSQNPMFCFNSGHPNNDTPACLIYKNNFKCQNSACGIQGDIYDACEILTGIKDKTKQYLEVEKTLKGYNFEEKKENKKTFEIDDNSLNHLLDYLRSHAGRNKAVMSFLKQRGYNDEIAKLMSNYMGYWPGFDIAKNEIDNDILFKAGIPYPYHNTGKSSWDHSGIVIKIGIGIKLCFYQWSDKQQKEVCEKRNSKSGFTFPTPIKVPKEGKIIFVEAELSAISMKCAGFKNVIATGGTNGLKIKIIKKLIEETKIEEFIFLFDGDPPGRFASGLIKQKPQSYKKSKNYPDIFIEEGFTGIIKIGEMPDGKDPDDFIVENKIEELKNIIENAKEYKSNEPIKKKKKELTHIEKTIKDEPFIFLGFDDRAYYIMPGTQNIVIKIKRGENYLKNWIKEIAPQEWWNENFQLKGEDGKTYFNIQAALAWFRKNEWLRGLYNDNRILGIGVHFDNDKIIFNTGRYLIIENEKKAYNDFIGENVYCRSKINLEFQGKEWTVNEGANYIKQIKTFHFERLIDYMAISGFTAISTFSTILNFRPHLWITGQSGSGKTTLLDTILKKIIGKEQTLSTEGCSTEAYIRQMIGKDCIIPLIDEFEVHNPIEKFNHKKILDLSRSCYGGIKLGKGTPDHKPVDFNIKLMFCFLSVNINIDDDGTRSRIVICRMRKKNKNDKNYVQDIENPCGLKIRIYKRIRKLNENIKEAKKIIMKQGYNNRVGDTYAPFIAGFWMIVSDNDFFQGDKIIQDFIYKAIEGIREEDIRNDEQRILDRIFQEGIKLEPSIILTIAEMLTEKKTNMEGERHLVRDKELQRIGLKRYEYKNKEVLAIDTDNQALKNILRDTAFSDYKEIVQRHDYVIKKSHVVHMAGKSTRCILLDWEQLNESYFKEKDDIPF